MYPIIVSLLMMLVVWTSLLQPIRRSSLLASAASQCIPSETNTCSSTTNQVKKIYRTVQVQIVHRHGDRTPITPLRNQDMWEKELISSSSSSSSPLHRISSLTRVLRDESFTHKASGKGPFGKLTKLGLKQMIDLGRRLRIDLVQGTVEHDEHGHGWRPHVITDGELHPHHVHVFSTDFERTLQSVQGVLAGLFPHLVQDHPHDSIKNQTTVFTIDARHTPWMIPDPQPRATQEQVELEQQLADQPHWVQQEEEMRPLAIRVTHALQDLLAEGAMDVTFGVAEGRTSSGKDTTAKTLSWAQLAEITKCLRVRNMLPPTISSEDQDVISKHLAQRWFGLLRHPRLSYLAMNRMASTMVQRMMQVAQRGSMSSMPPTAVASIVIYSAHDSTLIGLMCAFRLEQPTEWPEYGSFLKVELIEEMPVSSSQQAEPVHWVRFSLNSQPFQSQWEHDPHAPSLPSLDNNSNKYLIPLQLLHHHITRSGSKPERT